MTEEKLSLKERMARDRAQMAENKLELAEADKKLEEHKKEHKEIMDKFNSHEQALQGIQKKFDDDFKNLASEALTRAAEVERDEEKAGK